MPVSYTHLDVYKRQDMPIVIKGAGDNEGNVVCPHNIHPKLPVYTIFYSFGF